MPLGPPASLPAPLLPAVPERPPGQTPIHDPGQAKRGRVV